MIVAELIHCTRSQPPHEAQESILTFDLRRPSVHITAECHARGVRHIIRSGFVTLHELDQDGNTLIVIHQTLVVTVS